MGNHSAGRAMVQVAEALAAQREKTGQSALDILDIACSPYMGCDAEFDDSTIPGEPFANLITEAFLPEGMTVEDVERKIIELNENPEDRGGWEFDGSEWWYEEIYFSQFSKRYDLC